MKRALPVAAVVAALMVCAAPVRASAGTCRPLDDGGEVFGPINGPEDPEDYCFEVQLGEEQELRQIDDRHVEAFYSTGHPSFEIVAEEATDAVGTSVPTTLALTGADIVTLTVHHREGNPLAGGAPFDYPVVAGSGWEGGFHTTEVSMSPLPPPAPPSPPPAGEEAPAPSCTVPRLQGRSLAAARTVLHAARCRLGPIRGRRTHGARVVKQYRPAGRVLPAGAEVGVELAR